MLNHQPDHLLIKQANLIDKMAGRKNSTVVKMIDAELDSRQPFFEVEYDSDGQPIIDWQMGWDEDREVWTNLVPIEVDLLAEWESA